MVVTSNYLHESAKRVDKNKRKLHAKSGFSLRATRD